MSAHDDHDHERCSWCGGWARKGTTCPKSIICPKCGAPPGKRCRRPSGHEADTLHAERIKVAERDDPGYGYNRQQELL